VRFNEMRTTR